jgi:3-deoxy-manno-octulosonate cytidylyltransferase (CMP-KDO synthetase)
MLLAVIPFRLKSVRVPQKVILPIQEIPLCVRVVQAVQKSFEGLNGVQILAAVDSPKTQKLLENACPGLQVVMTKAELPSGTDRVHAAVQHFCDEQKIEMSSIKGILNIQGDMPFVGRHGLRAIAEYYLEGDALTLSQMPMATLSQSFPQGQNYTDMGAVKVISDSENCAMYFSRHPIPYTRAPVPKKDFIGDLHIGVYGFTPKALMRFCDQSPVAIEKAESLEQLRAMYIGMKILVIRTQPEAHESYRGIDTPQDLKWALSFGHKTRPMAKPKQKTKKAGRKKK